jgi:hypothetical protein
MKNIFRIVAAVILLIVAAFPADVYADIAPPANPPGSNPQPGAEGTEVRMMGETVLIDVLPDSSADGLGRAIVTASFLMRNLGSESESMAVRFPIGLDDGWVGIQEIDDLSVSVNGKNIPTRRVMQEDPVWGSNLVPWSEFDVTFPPGPDVPIKVTYTLDGVGYYPYTSFSYLFHTGAGWMDTIGSADLTVRFPYDVSAFNVLFDDMLWSHTFPNGVINGNEIRWHIEDFEPEQQDDFEVLIVSPSAWQKILNERENVENNPDDGEAWGRLAKLYKEVFLFSKGFRHDAGGQQLYQSSVDAYDKAVTFLPDDALWHAGFADLLAVYAYYASQEGMDVNTEILRAMQEINQALELSPNDPKVKEIAEKVYNFFPGAVDLLESGYDFLWLTATPVVESPTEALLPEQATSTHVITPAVPTGTSVPSPQPTAMPTSVPPTAQNPLCGTAMLLPLALIVWAGKTRRKPH